MLLKLMTSCAITGAGTVRTGTCAGLSNGYLCTSSSQNNAAVKAALKAWRGTLNKKCSADTDCHLLACTGRSVLSTVAKVCLPSRCGASKPIVPSDADRQFDHCAAGTTCRFIDSTALAKVSMLEHVGNWMCVPAAGPTPAVTVATATTTTTQPLSVRTRTPTAPVATRTTTASKTLRPLDCGKNIDDKRCAVRLRATGCTTLVIHNLNST